MIITARVNALESCSREGLGSDRLERTASAAAKARSSKCLKRLPVYRVRELEGGG